MTNTRGAAVGRYVMRLLGGLAVIVGVLGTFAGLGNRNLISAAIGVVFIIGGVFLLKRSARTDSPAAVPPPAG